MVQTYLLNGSWLGGNGTKPAFVEPDQDNKPPTNPEPQLASDHTTTDEASSLSLTIRVVQPIDQEATPAELPQQQSTWRRFLQVLKGKAA